MLLGISIAIMIGVGFARPISQLVLATQEIGKGNFQYRVERVRGDEFGDLASAFNYMSRELWKKLVMTKSFGSYVSPEILEMVMAHPDGDLLGGKRMEVTVVFTDIRGFTAYAEANDPERVVEAINEYFEIATRHIQKRGGYVDKFIGDAVLGVFGVPAGPARPRAAGAAGLGRDAARAARAGRGGATRCSRRSASASTPGVAVAGRPRLGGQAPVQRDRRLRERRLPAQRLCGRGQDHHQPQHARGRRGAWSKPWPCPRSRSRARPSRSRSSRSLG